MNDALNFIPAEEYFAQSHTWGGPKSVIKVTTTPPADAKYKAYWHGANITFDDGSLCVVQYVRPTLFRIRYDPTRRGVRGANAADEYTDVNTHTIPVDFMSELVHSFDKYTGLQWDTHLSEHDDYWTFESTVAASTPVDGRPALFAVDDKMKIVIYKNPFRIQALRLLKPVAELYPIPTAEATTTRKMQAIWQTSPRTFRVNLSKQHDCLKEIILDVVKRGHAGYVGYGEQGGTAFMKKACYMNYFNLDNMQYQQVYNNGPLDPREPLYHSDPFFLDLESNPDHQNVTATFIDNYSQIAVDFGKSNTGLIKLGVRYGGLDCYVISGDTVPAVIRQYTMLIGRQQLKPRYVLGNHQACYGYESDEAIHAVWEQYRQSRIPLDGIHIDVDFQLGFRTFTIDPGFFGKNPRKKIWNNAREMFGALKADGIKCSTNITPVISGNPITNNPAYPNGYTTLNEGLEGNRFVTDERYKDSPEDRPEDVRYMCYGGGTRYEIDPNSHQHRPDYGDDYDFAAVWDSKKPYHGAVSYGYGNGTYGHYPDLNDSEVRAWWGQQYKDLFEQGLEFVWQDMTTPAIGEAYGDMKGFPTRLMVNSGSGGLKAAGPGCAKSCKKLAIEAWALYPYNLHKATAQGLNELHKLVPARRGKRNFILGRGSYAGVFRFAGLWTGDNASTWDFWRITVPQVLSLGLNGVTIAGSDCGGFEPGRNLDGSEEKYCSPELLIRWYAGSVLLPWLRNHYVKKDRKYFQEPYAYRRHRDEHPEAVRGEEWLFELVPEITRYYVELRYSLMQVLYDAMFDNMFTGLPIAQSMIITETQDISLFKASENFLDNQYIVGHNILVAPVMQSRQEYRAAVKDENAPLRREVYLPVGFRWYQFNLNPWERDHRPLLAAIEGGSILDYEAEIKSDPRHFPYVTPMYIREGAIIPQLAVTQYVGDVSNGPNHIRYNIYPGQPGAAYAYTSYLDDGVSRASAPTELYDHSPLLELPPQPLRQKTADDPRGSHVDSEARSEYRAVRLVNETSDEPDHGFARTVTITRLGHCGDYVPDKELGDSYSIVFWYPPGEAFGPHVVTVDGVAVQAEVDEQKRIVKVRVGEVLGDSETIVVKVVDMENEDNWSYEEVLPPAEPEPSIWVPNIWASRWLGLGRGS